MKPGLVAAPLMIDAAIRREMIKWVLNIRLAKLNPQRPRRDVTRGDSTLRWL